MPHFRGFCKDLVVQLVYERDPLHLWNHPGYDGETWYNSDLKQDTGFNGESKRRRKKND